MTQGLIRDELQPQRNRVQTSFRDEVVMISEVTQDRYVTASIRRSQNATFLNTS
jgi:hypothetical protein